MQEICDGGYLIDPDQVMSELQIETTFVRNCVEQLMYDLENHPERFTNLNQLVDIASREFLMTASFPIVIQTTIDQTVPELSYPDEAVLAAVLRALEICTDHAGPGCEVHLATMYHNSRAILKIETRGSRTLVEPTLPIKVRSISLSDLVQSFGGEFVVTQEEDLLTVELLFGVRTSAV